MRCVVETVTAEALVALVHARVLEPETQPRVVVVQALAKGDRGERAVEVLTEVGVDEIVPWSASRSVTQWRADRGDKALERWRAIARESGKQSRRARFPLVAPLATTSAVHTRLQSAAGALVLDESATAHLGDVPLPTVGEIVLVVGPEGGIAPDELDRVPGCRRDRGLDRSVRAAYLDRRGRRGRRRALAHALVATGRPGRSSCQFGLTNDHLSVQTDNMNSDHVSSALAADDPAIGLRAVLALRRLAEQVEANQVALARRHGWSWQQIGDALGITRQSVHTKYGREG